MKWNSNCMILNTFAEDQVIISEGEEDTTYVFRKLKYTCDKWGLEISASKSNHLTTSLYVDTLMEGINIKTIDEFKNLGSIIYHDGSNQRKENHTNLEKRNSKCQKIN